MTTVGPSEAPSTTLPQDVAVRGARIAAVVQLQAIVLRDLNWHFPELPVPGGLAIKYEPDFRIEIGSGPGVVAYKLHSTIPATIPDGTEVFRLNSVHQLVFTVPEGSDFDLEEHQAFASTSVVFMAYPYVREELQSCAAKAGIAMALLPPLRIGPNLSNGSSAEDEVHQPAQ